MPVTVKLAVNGVVQAALVPDATRFNDGMVSPTMLRQLDALWARYGGAVTFLRDAPLKVPFNSTVAVPQTVVLGDARPGQNGVMTAAQAQQLAAMWALSGLTLPAAALGTAASLKFGLNLTCPQDEVLGPPTTRGGDHGGGVSGVMTGTMVQKLNYIVANPPGWSTAAGAPNNLDRIFGLSATNIWVGASVGALLYRYDGTSFTPTSDPYPGAPNFGNFWGPTADKLYVARAGASFGINVTVDGGVNWVTALKPGGGGGGDVYWVFGFEGTTDLYCAAVSAGGFDVWHTVNDGALWTRILDGLTVPGGALTLQGNQPFGGTGPNDLWMAADGFYGHYDGVGWTYYSAGDDVATWYNIASLAAGEIYLGGVAGGVGKVMHVTGGGAVRTLQTVQPYAGVLTVFGAGTGIYAVEYLNGAAFRVQKRVSDVSWQYETTQAGSSPTYGYTPDGVKALVVGLNGSQRRT